MVSMCKIEKVIYIFIVIVLLFTKIVNPNYEFKEIYNSIMSINFILYVYIPGFIFSVLNLVKNRAKSEIVIRYSDVYNYSLENIKNIFYLCIRIVVIIHCLLVVFLCVTEINILFNKSTLIFFINSFMLQIIELMITSIIFLILSNILRSFKYAYFLQVISILAIKFLMSPISYIKLPNFVKEFWQKSFFQSIDFSYASVLRIISINVLILSLLLLLYFVIIKKKDILLER